jgi:hypothetical protein
MVLIAGQNSYTREEKQSLQKGVRSAITTGSEHMTIIIGGTTLSL